MIQQTSLEAYKFILPELGEKQQDVLETIIKHPGMSNHDIAHFLDWEINTVTLRVNELRDLGLVDYRGDKLDRVTNRNVMTWEAIE